jgi:hypothetical protein
MAQGTLSPFQLTAGAGLLQNTGIVLNSNFSANVTVFNSIGFVANLLTTMSLASSAGLSSPTILSLQTLGNVTCPALGDSIPAGYANVAPLPAPDNYGFINDLANVGNVFLGNGNVGVFAQAFNAAQGYITQSNEFIISANNANQYLGPTFSNNNNLITSDITKVNLALPEFGQDLTSLGQTISLPNIEYFGEPATLLQQLSAAGNMGKGTLPGVQNALESAGLTPAEIADLITDNRQGLLNPNGLTENEFNTLQRRAYQGMELVDATTLADVLTILNVTTPNIANMTDLLDPVKMFPNSYPSLTYTVPPADPTLIYNTQGTVNPALQSTVNNTTVNGCEELGKVVPPQQAAAAKAVGTQLQQISGIININSSSLAQAVSNTETLKNLDLVEAQTSPISTATQNYWANTFAGGSGPDNTYLIVDFFGTASGYTTNSELSNVITVLNARVTDGTLTTLDSIYATMKLVVNGTYGSPTVGPVTIPVGNPGAGVYANAQAAMVVLIPLAQTEISTAATAMGTDTTTLNNAFTSMALAATTQYNNQLKANIDYTNLSATDQTGTLALVNNLPRLGLDTDEGQSAQFFEDIADLTIAAGQAIVATMRQGRNDVVANDAGISRYDIVPNTFETTPPQATLLGSSYTVAQARAAV